MDPALLCQLFFGLGTAVDIGGTFVPSFREHIMNYGSRSMTSSSSASAKSHRPPQNILIGVLKYLGSFRVPHTWFTHYYVVSVVSSIFWAFQIYSSGAAFRFLASVSDSKSATMTANQVFLAWLLMATQGARRLYESLVFTKPSQSKMWAGLWVIGIAFYVFIGISVWIEGIGSMKHLGPQSPLVEISLPSIKTMVAVPIFLFASGVQHDCHKYLADLKKYTLPQNFWFHWVVCPHYTSECLIYIAMAIVAAPKGQVLNRTIFAGLTFVASNLAVTADSTRKWYIEKFGVEKVAGRWRMIPLVF